MGAKSMRSSMLSSTAAPFDVALHGATGKFQSHESTCLDVNTCSALTSGLSLFAAFGQSEALTTRLRNIISAYVEGPGVLCELIQNADDAAATEVSFLLDTRSFGTNSVLSELISPCFTTPFGFSSHLLQRFQIDMLDETLQILLSNLDLSQTALAPGECNSLLIRPLL